MNKGKVPTLLEGAFRQNYRENRKKRSGRKAELWLQNEWVWLGALVSVSWLYKELAMLPGVSPYRTDAGPLDSTEFLFSFFKAILSNKSLTASET